MSNVAAYVRCIRGKADISEEEREGNERKTKGKGRGES